MKIDLVSFSNSDKKRASVLLVGVPDQTGCSYSKRKGTVFGPKAFRSASFMIDLSDPTAPIRDLKVCDCGDIEKIKVRDFVYATLKSKKFPIVIGGDHSITYNIMEGVDKYTKNYSIIYLDAHYDTVKSISNYHGSVLYDISKLKNVNLNASVIIGGRALTREEMAVAKNLKIKTFDMDFIIENGLRNLLSEVKNIITDKVYLSIDLDVLDPAFAPGVTTPVPGGLTSAECIYIIKHLAKLVNVGFDIMELNPLFDDKNKITSLLAVKSVYYALNRINI